MKKAKEGHDHGSCLRQFEEAFDATQDARRDAERDRDYYDGIQYTPEEVETLRQRKQPIVVSNRIKPKVDALLGFAKKKQMQPKAYPRTPKHEQEADSVTDAVRYACDQSRFDVVRMDAAENLFIEGVGAATVTVSIRGGEPEVQITHVPWDRFYYDPHSRRRDFSDASYMGVVLWMDESEVKRLAGEKSEALIQGCYDTQAGEGETYDDRPRNLSWSDKKRKRIRVLQHRYTADGQWMTAIVCKGGYIRDPQPSPYLDENGQPECDLLACSAYIDRENNRYGDVRQMISPQDEINKRRSKALHLLNSRLIVADMGAVVDVEATRREAARPDGYIEKMPEAQFEFPDHQGLVAGQFQLLQEAKAEIDASGVDPALSGDAQAPSGRAQEMLAQMGLAEKEVTFSALQDWTWRVYRAVWNRISQYWTEERWIRVTDDERNLRWVALNRQVQDPETGQVMVENGVAELDVDIFLEEGPDTVTVQAEQFQQLVDLKRADPSAIPTSAIIEASQLRNKEKLLEHAQGAGIPPQVQQQMQEMQQALQQAQEELQQAKQEQQNGQMDMAKHQADMQIKAAELQIKEKELVLKAQEIELDRYRAETDRMQALRPEPPRMNEQAA